MAGKRKSPRKTQKPKAARAKGEAKTAGKATKRVAGPGQFGFAKK